MPTTPEQHASILRKPFPANRISKLPRVNCPDCVTARSCGRHQRRRCDECGAFISTAHIHLDYIGHADVTDRLLEADPAWNWEPVAFNQHGLPAIDPDYQGLWIKLTVCGTTRLGFGDAPNVHSRRPAGDRMKEMIGDAIRNAAMRFGVGLDLWRKDPEGTNAGTTIAAETVTEAINTEPIIGAKRTAAKWLTDINTAKNEKTLRNLWEDAVRANCGYDDLPNSERIADAIARRKTELGLDATTGA